MDKLIKRTQYTDPNTGEVTYKDNGYVDMQFSDDNGYLLFKNKNAIRTFIGIDLPEGFSIMDEGRIARIKKYILWENQLITYRSKNVIKPVTIKELPKIWETTERQCKEFIRKLKHNGIVKEVWLGNTKYFCFNPFYGMKDKRLTLTLFIIFQDEMSKRLPQWVVQKFLEQVKELSLDIKIVK